MSIYQYLFYGVFVLIFLIVVGRYFVCWYFRIDRICELLEEIVERFDDKKCDNCSSCETLKK